MVRVECPIWTRINPCVRVKSLGKVIVPIISLWKFAFQIFLYLFRVVVLS